MRLHRFLFPALALVLALPAAPVQAADNFPFVAGGSTRQMRSKDIGGFMHNMVIMTDPVTGNPWSPTLGFPVAPATGATFPVNWPTTWYVAAGTSGTGALGSLVHCLASAAAPTYTANTLNPLSCDLAGTLRTTAGGGGGGGAVTQSGTWNIANITGTVSLPTGASTAARQDTTNTALGAPADAAVTNPASSASAIAALKGINSQLTTLNTTASSSVAAGNNKIGRVEIVDAANGSPIGAPGDAAVTNPATSGSTIALLKGVLTGLASLNTTAAAPVAAGTNTIGAVGLVPMVAGGLSTYSIIAANTNNSTLISAGPHNVYTITVYNPTATIAWLKLYDKATAPNCGTDTPKERHMIPASTSGAGAVIPSDLGTSFSLGLGFCIVTGVADNDNTAPAAGSAVINVRYN